MLDNEPLPEDRQLELLKEYEVTRDIHIRNKLVVHNTRLVNWTINRYFNFDDIQDKEDYQQIGIIGLMESLETYNYRKGKLSNYAIYNIRRTISRAIENQSRTIRIPSHMHEKRREVSKARATLTEQLEREPTLKEISLKCNLPQKEIKEILNVIDDSVSLNAPVKLTEEQTTLQNTIPDDSFTTDEIVESKIFMENFHTTARETLSDIEYDTLTMVLGIGMRKHLEKEVAKLHNCTRQNINLVKVRAIKKIKETKLIKDRINEETIYYKSMDYSKPSGGNTNKISSSVENIVLEREYKFQKKISQ